ncbi:MAG: hypothetical protein PHI64_20220 [Zoogloea sp.]|uniref:N-acyl amino acid synthase FeeM domain-containing protein n=1 Tax=Zoogloea sp. TaxID=49181 RepID=UPI00260F1A4A|nr:hypothetical protein [Zoogloea sp.]MDD2991269.1 hypothetical protein [Zoogloea sp.]
MFSKLSKPPVVEESAAQTLAEVTAMESWRFDPLCIAEDDPKVDAPNNKPSKFRLKMLMRDGERRRETELLIEKRYAWRGYGKLGSLEEPNQLTMNAELFGRVYATLTVNVDSPAGLALDKTYGPEAARLRAQGRKLCEFGRFAIDPSARSKRLIASLFNLLYIYAYRVKGCTDILIEINPRHRDFYEKLLEFKQLSGERMCERVKAPALLMHLSCATIEQRLREVGGRWRELPDEKSIYKFAFAPDEEAEMINRLGY